VCCCIGEIAAVSATAGANRRWASLSDEHLLQLRFCDLPLRGVGRRVTRAMAQLRRELRARGIAFEPHVWLAEEWFSPDGVPGFAVPFFLAHPRLAQLERNMSGQVEGIRANWLMRILRHEAGHALDNAYRLRRRRDWREIFGPASLPYPQRYRARPGSRRYVHHLGDWYAQAHPTEDFAETFAVWLQPRSGWRRSYADWPALNKLQLVERLMHEAGSRAPAVRRRELVEPLSSNTRTLAEHYRRRAAQRIHHRRGLADELLQRVFTPVRQRANTATAAAMLNANKSLLARRIMQDCGVDKYTAYQMLRMVIARARRARVYQRGARRVCLRHAVWLLVRLTRSYSNSQSPALAL
jgi:hypothetical protein